MLDKLDTFIGNILSSPAMADAIAASGVSNARQLVEIYTNEARVGLNLIQPLLRPGLRILEIGCGIGLLARFLRDEGHDVTGIEPGDSGFGFMPTLSRAILSLDPPLPLDSWHACGAEALNPQDFGLFDLIYSTNVLEHIPDLAGAFLGMASVLAPKGRMVHLCPNYAVPYEPHFGLPLVPFAPELTRHIFPQVVNRLPGVWEGLNFITAREVRHHAAANGLSAVFDRGVMAAALHRFDQDPLFRQRQGHLAALIHSVLKKTKALALIDRLPGEVATPMIMRITHASEKPIS